MKKEALFKTARIFSFAAMVLVAQTAKPQGGWSLGISAASLGNYSAFSGGMSAADARFHHNVYGAGSLGFVARRTYNEHWAFQTGLGFSSVGFSFALTQNYSLLKESGHYVGTNASNGTVSIPATVIYTTRLNCRNWRKFVGAGFSLLAGGQQNNITSKSSTLEDNTTVSLSQQTSSPGFLALNAQAMAGIEKVYRNNSIFSLGIIFNLGTSNVYTTNVTYTLDGKDYNHTFTNRGTYAGVFAAYFFRPVGTGKKK